MSGNFHKTGLWARGAAEGRRLDFLTDGIALSHPGGTLVVQTGCMSEYVIGSGAILTAGPNSTITGATLHAQTDPRLAPRVEAAVIDFEGVSDRELSRIVIVATGWSRPKFEAEVIRSLLACTECSLADVIHTLRKATGADEVHLFARWSPDGHLLNDLARMGVCLIAHPLETLDQAALVSGQRLARWRPHFRAA